MVRAACLRRCPILCGQPSLFATANVDGEALLLSDLLADSAEPPPHLKSTAVGCRPGFGPLALGPRCGLFKKARGTAEVIQGVPTTPPWLLCRDAPQELPDAPRWAVCQAAEPPLARKLPSRGPTAGTASPRVQGREPRGAPLPHMQGRLTPPQQQSSSTLPAACNVSPFRPTAPFLLSTKPLTHPHPPCPCVALGSFWHVDLREGSRGWVCCRGATPAPGCPRPVPGMPKPPPPPQVSLPAAHSGFFVPLLHASTRRLHMPAPLN